MQTTKDFNTAAPTAKEVELRKTYFRDDPRYGRTTTLVLKATGAVLGCWMGVIGKGEALRQFSTQNV